MSRPRAAALACLVFFAVAVVAPPALAQWSSDPAVNSPIAVKSGDQVQPKVRPIPGGGWYVSWFDDETGGYDVYLQRLDVNGVAQWAAGGIRVADLGFSSTEDYGLDVDGSGNALLAFDDDRFATRKITATKIDPAGSPLWGANGIQMPETTGDVHSPKIADLVANKVDAAGNWKWNATPPGLVIYDGNSLQMGNFPPFVNDGAGGAAFGWYDISQQCYAQHVTSAGVEAFGHNGVAASTDASHSRVAPSVQFNPETGETLLFFVEQFAGQQGVFGQKYNASGTRQWTNNGAVIRPLAGVTVMDVYAVQAGGDSLVFWTDETGYAQDAIYAQRVGGNGSAVCATFPVSTLLAIKANTDASINAAGMTVATWQQGDFGAADVYAQNVNADCSLGGSAPPLEVSPPGAAQPLVFTDGITLLWEDKAASGSDTCNLYRGDTTTLPAGQYGDCLQHGLTGSTATDSTAPGTGLGFFYLVSGKNAGGEGSLGNDSAGHARQPASACP
ncbi:MAG: hypothetical protein H6Q01_1210 [Acidobacteria bacterium]|nr:hypothetical protein [Acidobacteriota bacterium]